MHTISEALKHRQAVLFVGAGVSMSVGLPSWMTFIDHLLTDLAVTSRRPSRMPQTISRSPNAID
ncbi:hypothetical protein [Rhizobium sp. GR12]|uniref:hypothetical protein n=1 Tax=Rhizobium sp. GR12 TaxID=3053925 RepID=UPI002FBDFD73